MTTPSITEMLRDLIAAGMTQQGIAEAIGVTQPTVFRALNGAELRYGSGKELEKLYLAKGTGEQRDPDGTDRRHAERRKAERRQAERRA
ncbi:hypothetical protein GFK99_21945 [Pseudomonas stutzeri]|nr:MULTISPECIES: hypothetical protein [Pseudomonadaceae]MBK3797518.1 hypothetical protein [Stutzerimonas stutzeri]MBK3876357.1 hypothetical protein [Stutzerimonas stutzeri]